MTWLTQSSGFKCTGRCTSHSYRARYDTTFTPSTKIIIIIITIILYYFIPLRPSESGVYWKKSYIKNGISYHNIFNNLLVNVIHWIAVYDSLTSYCLKFGLGVSIEVWSNLWGYLVSQLSDNIMQAFWCSGSGVYVNEDFIKRLSRTSIKCRNDQNKV